MATIVRGTTPTIRYTFSSVDVNDITVAKLIVKQNGQAVISKELTDGTIGENCIDWKLSQEETLSLTREMAKIGLDWLLSDGTRGVGNTVQCLVSNSNYDQVLENE